MPFCSSKCEASPIMGSEEDASGNLLDLPLFMGF
jgi:hypothetical protein